jgi:hypothetical protein
LRVSKFQIVWGLLAGAGFDPWRHRTKANPRGMAAGKCTELFSKGDSFQMAFRKGDERVLATVRPIQTGLH